MDISDMAAQQVALTHARVQTELAIRLTRIARQVGAPQQMLELVRDATAAAAQTAQTALTPDGGLDVRG